MFNFTLRDPESQSLHDRAVANTYSMLHDDGMWTDVRADTLGAAAPLPIGAYVPDLTGWWNAQFYVIEVETADSYDGSHALAQYRAFDGGGKLIVVVPLRVESATAALLARMGISGSVWPY